MIPSDTGTTSSINGTPAELFDFHNIPLTNEQRIVNALETLVVLLTPKAAYDTPDTKPSRAEQLDALAAKTMGRRK